MQYFVPYITALLVFLGIDSIWLKVMNTNLYQPEIGHLMAETPNLKAAAVFYLFYILAACFLVIYPALKQSTTGQFLPVFFFGAVLGAACYGTYDFTCMAVFKDFPLKVALIDTAWGAALTGSVCAISYAISSKYV